MAAGCRRCARRWRSSADALDRLRSGTAHHHRGLAPGHRPGLAHPGRSGRGGLGRGPGLLGRAHRAAGQWPAHPPSAGGRGRHAGAAGSRRRAAALHLRHAVASVPAGAGDVAGAPPPAAGGCAAPWQLDHRGRLRQRVPLLGAAHRLAAGAGAGCARDLHGHLQQDAVPGAARGLSGAAAPLVAAFQAAHAELYPGATR